MKDKNRRLTNAQVIEIKKLLAEGKTKTSWMCTKYDCSRQTINNIKNQGYFSELNDYVD